MSEMQENTAKVEPYIRRAFQASFEFSDWQHGFEPIDVLNFLAVRNSYLQGVLSFQETLDYLKSDIGDKVTEDIFIRIRPNMERSSFQTLSQEPNSEIAQIEAEHPIPKPYTVIRIVLLFLVREEVREDLLGDIGEMFAPRYEEFGPKVANAWYVKECALSLWPLLQAWLLRVGAISFLYDLWRRMGK